MLFDEFHLMFFKMLHFGREKPDSSDVSIKNHYNAPRSVMGIKTLEI